MQLTADDDSTDICHQIGAQDCTSLSQGQHTMVEGTHTNFASDT